MRIALVDTNHDSLKPLTYTRSVSDLELGGSTLYEHVSRGLEADPDLIVPEYLEEVTRCNSEFYDLQREVNPDIREPAIIYNSGVIPNEEIVGKLPELDVGEGLFYEDTFVAGLADKNIDFEDLDNFTSDLNVEELNEEPITIEYPWDMYRNHPELLEDFFPGGEIKGDLGSANIIGDHSNVYIGENTEVMDNTTIDVTEGPVYIDSDTKIWPNSRIEGPTYIGSDSKIGAGQNAVIHEGTHIGDVTRIGGEVEEAIVHSFTNKYHYGFLGHAVVGSWVNFGAGTTNSDLKSTYGEVVVDHPTEGEINAGLKVGTTIGDHTRLDIGTMISTGKMIGPVAKATDRVMENKTPFTWKTPENEAEYIKDKAIVQAERMMSHREEKLPQGYIEAHKNLIENLTEEI